MRQKCVVQLFTIISTCSNPHLSTDSTSEQDYIMLSKGALVALTVLCACTKATNMGIVDIAPGGTNSVSFTVNLAPGAECISVLGKTFQGPFSVIPQALFIKVNNAEVARAATDKSAVDYILCTSGSVVVTATFSLGNGSGQLEADRYP